MDIAERSGDEPTPSQEAENLTKDLPNLTENQMAEVITKDLLDRENNLYRSGNTVPADHKILFLIGDETNDVTRATDLRADRIYTKESSFPKAPEIPELNASISRYFEKDRQNLPEVLSETADIFYNLAQLRELDPEFRDVYSKWMNYLARSIGLDLGELFGLAIIKYRRRLIQEGGEKDVLEEEKLLQSFVTEGQSPGRFSVRRPSDDGLKKFYRVVNLLGNKILAGRFTQLRANLSAEEELTG